jgi:hypothetical protein
MQACRALLITSNRAERTAESINKRRGGEGGIESFFEESIIICRKYKHMSEK